MVVNELNFSTTRFTIYHACTGSDTNDDLFIERATDSTVGEFGDESGSCAEDTAFWAAHVLTINEEVGVTFCQFCQCFINSSQHG